MTETPESTTEPATVTSQPRYNRPGRLSQVLAWVGIVAGAVFVAAVIFFSGIFLGWYSGGHYSWHRGGAGQMSPRSSQQSAPSQTLRLEVELPFIGLYVHTGGVAVDTAGNVYVASGGSDRVLKLPAGSSTAVELAFTGLKGPMGVAVDTAGNVYVTDTFHNRVLKLPAGSSTQVELAFTGLHGPGGVAVDAAGNVYVTDFVDNRVLKLPAGSSTQVELPFPFLTGPMGVAVDSAGNVYVTNHDYDQVLELPAPYAG